MTPKKAPAKKGKKPVKAAPKPVPQVRHVKPKPAKRRKSLSEVRARIDIARSWYVSRLIPADGTLPAVKNPSIDDVAERANVRPPTLYDRSVVEGWVQRRKDAQAFDDAEALRVETETRNAIIAQNNRLIQQLGDQHARARTQAFSRAINAGRRLDVLLAEQELDVDGVATLTLASGRVQEQVDTAVVGPKALLAKDIQPNLTQVNVGIGWNALASTPPPALASQLAAIDAQEPHATH